MVLTTSFTPIFSLKYIQLSHRHNKYRYFCNCDVLTVNLKNIDSSDNSYLKYTWMYDLLGYHNDYILLDDNYS